MLKQQIPTWVEFGDMQKRFESQDSFRDYFESFPEISIFFDLDCYQNNVSFDAKDEFIKKAFQNMENTAKQLKTYILG